VKGGRINYDLLDASRQEPFLNNPHTKREIIVTVNYPEVELLAIHHPL
jgi:hypothetical protein